MKKYFQSYTPVERILLAVLAILIGWLVYCNLFHMDGSVEADIAKTMVHAREMGIHRTFYLRDWDYWTNAEWDFSAAPAAILYILTGNIFLSFGIANTVNIFLWIIVLTALFRHMKLERTYRLLLMCVVFASYDWGDVWYTADMLFFGVGWYVYRVLIPLLFLTLLSTEKERRKSKWNLIGIALYTILVFVTGASSGTYVFLCGLFPVFLCMLVFLLMERHITKYEGLMVGITVISTGLGVYLCNRLEISPNSTSMMLRSVTDVQESPFKTFFTLLEVWHVLPQESTAVLSLTGIAEMIKLAFVMILLILACCSLKYVFGICLFTASEGEQIQTPVKLRISLISIFVWNYLILFLTRATARYQLLGAIPLVLCAGFALQEWCGKMHRPELKKGIPVLAGLCTLCITLFSTHYDLTTHFHQADGVVSFGRELEDILDEKEINTVYVLGVAELCEELRLYDDERLYVCIDPADEMRGVNRIYYYGAHDRIAGDNRNAIVARVSVFAQCPDYVKNSYEQLDGEYRFDAYFNQYAQNPEEPYCVWASEHNPIDGMEGIPRHGDGIDLPCSPGYIYVGEIDADGHLHTSETGVVMESVPLGIIPYGHYRMEVDCETAGSNDDLRIEVMSGEEIYATLSPDKDGVCAIDFTEDGTYRLRITKTDTSEIVVGQIRFVKLDE